MDEELLNEIADRIAALTCENPHLRECLRGIVSAIAADDSIADDIDILVVEYESFLDSQQESKNGTD
jgi:hypothetical protein